MTDDSQISALERLTKLRDSGALSEEEFASEKAKLLTGAPNPPFFRRLWFVVLLTCLLLTFPISLLILVTGNVFKRTADGSLAPLKNKTRYIYAALLALWAIGAIVRAIIHSGDWEASAVSTTNSPVVQNASGANSRQLTDGSLEACKQVGIKVGMAFADVREKLTKAGFQAAQLGMGDVYCDQIANDCSDFDEVQNCGRDGVCAAIYVGSDKNNPIDFQIEAHGSIAKSTIVQVDQQCQQSNPPPEAPKKASSSEGDHSPPATSPINGQDADTASPKDPLESRYTPDFEKCLATGDAANGSTSALLACTNQELAAQDAMLNNTYRTTYSDLPPDQQASLRDAQRQWIKDRDSKCVPGNPNDGDISQLDRPSCLLSETIERTMALEKMQGK